VNAKEARAKALWLAYRALDEVPSGDWDAKVQREFEELRLRAFDKYLAALRAANAK